MRVTAEEHPDVRVIDKGTGQVVYGVRWADSDTREVHRFVTKLAPHGEPFPVDAPLGSATDFLEETVEMPFRIVAWGTDDRGRVLAETAE